MQPGNEELWAEYAIGAFFIVLRFYARWKVVGFEGMQLDDAFMLVAFMAYSAITGIIEAITAHGNTIGQTEESVYLLTPEMVESFEIGGKLTFVDWILYILYVWALKAALLCMYWRMTERLNTEAKITKFVTGFTAVAFTVAMLTHLCGCIPASKAWQVVPYPGDACALRNINYYVVSICNALSDAFMIIIPIPILFKARISPVRRILLGVLLCSGAFVIVATILRAYYSLQSITTLPIAAGWTSRELFIAAMCVSAPGIKPLFSNTRWFRGLGSSGGGNNTDGNGPTGGGSKNGGTSRAVGLVTIGGGGAERPPAGKSLAEWRISGKEVKGERLSSDNGSEEHIVMTTSHEYNSGHDTDNFQQV